MQATEGLCERYESRYAFKSVRLGRWKETREKSAVLQWGNQRVHLHPRICQKKHAFSPEKVTAHLLGCWTAFCKQVSNPLLLCWQRRQEQILYYSTLYTEQ